MKALDALTRNPTLALVAAVAAVQVLAAADYLTGTEVSFALLYLGPVALASWVAGSAAGAAIAVCAALEWQLGDWLAGERFSGLLVPLWNNASRIIVLVVFAVLLSRLKAALERERGLSRIDELTGVPNARAFHESAARELARSRRYGHPVTILFFDLDCFKELNDRAGHSAGDAALLAVGNTLRRTLRGTDLPARLGGDEFVVLFPETGCAAAAAVIGQLRAALLTEMRHNGWTITFSMGARTYTKPPSSTEEMVQDADRLMYDAKASGRDRLEHACG